MAIAYKGRRYFGGNKYDFVKTCRTKSAAQKAASSYRKGGGLARITKAKTGYNLWVRG